MENDLEYQCIFIYRYQKVNYQSRELKNNKPNFLPNIKKMKVIII